jgi:ribokinase
MTPRICVVGSSNIDLTFRTHRLPAPGETLPGHSVALGYGGKGANQAVMAARLGAHVTLVARVGRDVFGDGMFRTLIEQGIDTAHVTQDALLPSGTAAILVDDLAQNSIIVVPGANGVLSPADVERASGAITGASVLLCQLEVPIAATLAAFRIARAAKVRTILNPAPAQELSAELLQLADLCVPNETELTTLTGQPTSRESEVAEAAQLLKRRGPRAVLTTLGGRGALLVEEVGQEWIAPLSVRAVDPTGAGDAFIGALAVFLAEGRTLREAARRANAAAALSVTKPGAQASFPTRADVEQFLSSQKGMQS